jgi:hypothetical protein
VKRWSESAETGPLTFRGVTKNLITLIECAKLTLLAPEDPAAMTQDPR